MSLLTKNSTPREVDLFLPWCLRSQLGGQHTPTLPPVSCDGPLYLSSQPFSDED